MLVLVLSKGNLFVGMVEKIWDPASCLIELMVAKAHLGQNLLTKEKSRLA